MTPDRRENPPKPEYRVPPEAAIARTMQFFAGADLAGRAGVQHIGVIDVEITDGAFDQRTYTALVNRIPVARYRINTSEVTLANIGEIASGKEYELLGRLSIGREATFRVEEAKDSSLRSIYAIDGLYASNETTSTANPSPDLELVAEVLSLPYKL